jgi:hypothetical protein
LAEGNAVRQVVGLHAACFILVSAAIILPGCAAGKAGVKIEGKLTKDGKSMQVKQGENLHLSLQSKVASGEPAIYPAKINPADGSFVVEGLDGKGIPPGTYKVSLSLTSGATDPAGLARMKKLGQQFKAINGKEFEVGSEAGQMVTIDITKGTITK